VHEPIEMARVGPRLQMPTTHPGMPGLRALLDDGQQLRSLGGEHHRAGHHLLFSVAAAVTGATSLIGGRGKPRDAIIGALVIAIIPNGLGLNPSLGPQWQQVITGVVLLVAAAVDAISRRRAARG
jgi:ribose/xylose/arabinose/galactoside ABC-type transport system permease subunit